MSDYNLMIVNEINAVKKPIDNLIEVTKKTLQKPHLDPNYQSLLNKRLETLTSTSNRLQSQIDGILQNPHQLDANNQILTERVTFTVNKIEDSLGKIEQKIAKKEDYVTTLKSAPNNLFMKKRVDRVNAKITQLKQKEAMLSKLQSTIISDKISKKISPIIKDYNQTVDLHKREKAINDKVTTQDKIVDDHRQMILQNQEYINDLVTTPNISNQLLAARYQLRNYRLALALPKLKLKQGFYKGCQLATIKIHELYSMSKNQFVAQSR